MSVVAIPTARENLSDSNISTLELLYDAVGAVNFTPGWIPRSKPILWAEPRPQFMPAHWSYEDAKAGLDAAGRIVDHLEEPGQILHRFLRTRHRPGAA